MQISLNGDKADAHGAQTVDDLVHKLGLPATAILIEHNGIALHRREWSQTRLTEGDQVEIVRVVAGG